MKKKLSWRPNVYVESLVNSKTNKRKTIEKFVSARILNEKVLFLNRNYNQNNDIFLIYVVMEMDGTFGVFNKHKLGYVFLKI